MLVLLLMLATRRPYTAHVPSVANVACSTISETYLGTETQTYVVERTRCVSVLLVFVLFELLCVLSRPVPQPLKFLNQDRFG